MTDSLKINLDKLEENTHLILYYLYKIYPARVSKKDLVKVTQMHKNTVSNKLNILKEVGLLETKRSGRSINYFITEEVKSFFEKWTETELGRQTTEEFDNKLNET